MLHYNLAKVTTKDADYLVITSVNGECYVITAIGVFVCSSISSIAENVWKYFRDILKVDRTWQRKTW